MYVVLSLSCDLFVFVGVESVCVCVCVCVYTGYICYEFASEFGLFLCPFTDLLTV